MTVAYARDEKTGTLSLHSLIVSRTLTPKINFLPKGIWKSKLATQIEVLSYFLLWPPA